MSRSLINQWIQMESLYMESGRKRSGKKYQGLFFVAIKKDGPYIHDFGAYAQRYS